VKNAFTLIELLVVIAILAVLIGLSLPVMSAAKVASARAISAHSLSELIVAGRLYLNDNNNNFWAYKQPAPGGAQWWFGFETSASLGMPEGQRTCDYSKGPLGPYTMTSGGVKTDPAFLRYNPRLKPKYQNGNYGYGYNTLLVGENSLRFDNLGGIVVFGTCAQVNTFQAPASSSSPMVEEFYMIDSTQTTVHFRHGDKALAAFLDGSVREMKMSPGTRDNRLPSANIGRFAPVGSTQYLQ
jgi:prepilin-type N-terminal cleavage/methylation domain-containing protein/prepilin-type processing-associated H-X9-DG protein